MASKITSGMSWHGDGYDYGKVSGNELMAAKITMTMWQQNHLQYDLASMTSMAKSVARKITSSMSWHGVGEAARKSTQVSSSPLIDHLISLQ